MIIETEYERIILLKTKGLLAKWRQLIISDPAVVRDDQAGSRLVKSGSSYLSQSELALTFGLGKRGKVDRAVLTWPSGRVEEYKNLPAGRLWECTEGKGVRDTGGF